MVISIGQLDVILVVEPHYRFAGQFFEAILVDAVADDDGEESAELSL